MPQQRTSSPYPSSSGKDQSTTPRDVKDTLREAKDTPREVKVLKDIRRMERDRDMMLRAGYLQVSYLCMIIILSYYDTYESYTIVVVLSYCVPLVKI